MATLVIAEAGVNHNGDVDMAHRLIDAAVDSGADFIKFQTFSPNDLASADAPKADYQINHDGDGSQLDMLRRLTLSDEDHRQLAAHCRNAGIQFLSTAFGLRELDLLLDIGINAIKVPSGEITHRFLLEAMAAAAVTQELPVFLSTGMCSIGDVDAALQIFLDAGLPRERITILHCLSAYPAPDDQINLRAMSSMSAAFSCPVGFSDHTLGIHASVAAVALGASVIEKHLTLDSSLPGPDHCASLEPSAFTQLVTSIRSVERMLGDGIKQPQESELNTRFVARRSLRAARSIQAGQRITRDDLLCSRPGDGLSPMAYPLLIDCVASRDYSPGQLMTQHF